MKLKQSGDVITAAHTFFPQTHKVIQAHISEIITLEFSSSNFCSNNLIHMTRVVGVLPMVKQSRYSGPEGSRKLCLPDFLTTAQDGALRTGRLYLQEMLLLLEAESIPEP